MIKLNCNKIISLVVFTMFFVSAMHFVDLLVYKMLPFDHFVNYTNIQRSDICYGDKTQELLVERIVRKDVSATITSELFLMRHDTKTQISDIGIKIFQEKIDIVYDRNNTHSELIQIELPHLEVGEYYWIELTKIELPRGLSKTKLLDPQYFNVLEC